MLHKCVKIIRRVERICDSKEESIEVRKQIRGMQYFLVLEISTTGSFIYVLKMKRYKEKSL